MPRAGATTTPGETAAGRAGADPRADAAEAIRATIERVEGLAAEVDANAWTRSPNGGWSAAQCLEHLSITAEEASSLFAAAPDRPGRRLRRSPRWWIRLLVRSFEPPPRFKTRTSRTFRPQPAVDPEAALARYRTSHEALAGAIAAIGEDDLHRVSIRSPFGPFAYTGLEWALLLAAHARRHLWQAERALRHAA